MRILHVLDTCGAGGIEQTFLNVLTSWTASPWCEHHVLAFEGGTLEEPLRRVTSEVVVPATAGDIPGILGREYDVVHFLFDRAAYRWLPWVAGRSRAAIVYGKGYDLAGGFRCHDGFCWQPDESLMWGSDCVTCTTDALADGYRLPAERTTILGKAADVNRFLQIPWAGPASPLRIVCVANLHALKRIDDLIRALARLRLDHPELRLRLVGADRSGEGARLVALAAQLGVGDACEFVGYRTDVAQDLAESRIFALPSSREGVPTAMLEAMAAARPVVVTDVGHVSSVVTDGVEGFVVPVADHRALVDRLDQLLRSPERVVAMGLAGRLRVSVHDVAVVATRLRAVLEDAAARVRAARATA